MDKEFVDGANESLEGINNKQDKEELVPGGYDVSKARISLEENIPDPDVILFQISSDAPLFTQIGLSMTVGASKSRKTSFIVVLAAGSLGDTSMGIEATRSDNKVIIIDTEQGRQYAAMTLRRIHLKLGWDINKSNDRLQYYDLSDCDEKTRLQCVEYLVKKERPNIVFIDGIVDLCENFNDITESKKVIQKLKSLTVEYQMHICGCLHFNKDGETARGHLGAIYLQKCETVFQVENKGTYSTVTPHQKGCRLKPFEKFSFTMDEDTYVPVLFDETSLAVIASQQKPRPRMERARKYAEEAFANNENKPMRHDELARGIMDAAMADNVKSIVKRTARRYIQDLLVEGFLTKSEGGIYVLTARDKNEDTQTTMDIKEKGGYSLDPDEEVGELPF